MPEVRHVLTEEWALEDTGLLVLSIDHIILIIIVLPEGGIALLLEDLIGKYLVCAEEDLDETFSSYSGSQIDKITIILIFLHLIVLHLKECNNYI